MAADWEFDCPLDDTGRELVVQRLRVMRASVPATSSTVAVVVGEFLEQVERGESRVRLHMSRLDKFGLLHLSALMGSLCPPTGYARCLRCNGSGEVRMPEPAAGLATALDRRYGLYQLTGPERAEHLEWPADPAERERIVAASRAEARRLAEARAKSEERARMRVEPGELAPGEPVFEAPAPVAEFVPSSVRERS